jgi:hypothetical protein
VIASSLKASVHQKEQLPESRGNTQNGRKFCHPFIDIQNIQRTQKLSSKTANTTINKWANELSFQKKYKWLLYI